MASAIYRGGAYVLPVHIAALGTAETVDVVVPFAGRITYVAGVSSVAQTTGISTVTVVNGDDDAIASLAFAADYAAHAVVSDTSITNATVAQGDILKVATNGTGDGTGAAVVTVLIEV